jgi:hypothetical protein
MILQSAGVSDHRETRARLQEAGRRNAMILRSKADNRSYEAVITAGHPRATAGRAILLVDRKALTPQESASWRFEIVSASEAERMLLENNGYIAAWAAGGA